ncbi:MAG: hypothetical protein DRH26_14830 [Deltaproteobacteria bacterium]|nr:MAG: hypothetical protein DRH26_14830 [Deltaproteobacteria bacterium]
MHSPNYVEHKNTAKNFPLADFADILNIASKKKIRITFKAEGASMSPFVKTGDILTINLNDFNPSIGTVVAHIDSKKKVLIHRIIARQGDRYILKGDNCKFIDGIMSKDSFAGYVESVQRRGKFVLFGLGKEKIFIVLLSRSGLLFPILLFLRGFKKYIRELVNG